MKYEKKNNKKTSHLIFKTFQVKIQDVVPTHGPFLLPIFSQDPLLSEWPILPRSWQTPSRLPAPVCEAHRWLFHPGCRPQPEAELDVSQNHVAIYQHPAANGKQSNTEFGHGFLVKSIFGKQKCRYCKTHQNSLGCDAVSQSTWHAHFNSSFCQRFCKKIHLDKKNSKKTNKID